MEIADDRISRLVILLGCLACCCSVSVGASESFDTRDEARMLLVRWCDALIGAQINDAKNPYTFGGALCPACGFQHARICDAVYPFVYLWVETSDGKYLAAAKKALTWAEGNYRRSDGSYWNDRKTPWKGTTVFCQIAIGKTLLFWGDRLPKDVADEWRAIFLRQSDFLVSWFNDPNWRGVINYPSAFCEAMALAWKLTGEERYRVEALTMWRTTVNPLINEEGFLSGEGQPMRGKTAVRKLSLVDIGYNLEESLPALAAAAEMLGDCAMTEKILESARAHMAFVIPDGGIDDSFGARSAKWTYYGSRTSDGILPLYAFLARHGESCARQGAERTIRLYRELTSADGFLYGGLRYADADEPPCLHHTFAHAKALADWLASGISSDGLDGPLPREVQKGLRTFSSIAVTLASVGPWRATFSASDAFPGRDYALSGGALSLLWHRDMGPVVCGTMPVYRYPEWVNQQDQRHAEKTLCMTPRIVAEELTNLSDYECEVKTSEAGDTVFYNVSGRLTSLDASARKGSAYCIDYELTEKGLSLSAKCAEIPFSFVFPVIVDRSTTVSVNGRVAELTGGRINARVTASSDLTLVNTERGDFAFSPIAGVLAAVFEVHGGPGETIRIDFRPKEGPAQ